MQQMVISASVYMVDVLHPVCMMAHSNQLQKDHYVTFSSAEAQKRAESKGQKKGQQFLLTLGIL